MITMQGLSLMLCPALISPIKIAVNGRTIQLFRDYCWRQPSFIESCFSLVVTLTRSGRGFTRFVILAAVKVVASVISTRCSNFILLILGYIAWYRDDVEWVRQFPLKLPEIFSHFIGDTSRLSLWCFDRMLSSISVFFLSPPPFS